MTDIDTARAVESERRDTESEAAPAAMPMAPGGLSPAQLQRRLLQRRAVQRQGIAVQHDDSFVHAAAAKGVSGGGESMPHAAEIQRSFGRHDVSDVRAHTGGAASDAAQAIGAEAYATGNDVAFGGAPSLHTAAHEAAHVVQQRAGVHLKGGVGAEGDVYERHADQVADAVVAGRSAEALLDPFAGGSVASAGVQREAVQRYIAIGPGGAEVSTAQAAIDGITREATVNDPSNLLPQLQTRDQEIRTTLDEWIASSGEFATNAKEYGKAVTGMAMSPQPAQWRKYRNFYELGVAVVYETHPQTVVNKQYEGQLAGVVVQDGWVNAQLNIVKTKIYQQLHATIGQPLLDKFTSEVAGDEFFSLGKIRGSYRQIGSYVEGGGMKLNVMNFLQQLQAGFQTNIAVIHDMMEHLSGPGGGAKFKTSLGGTVPEPRDEAYETTLLKDAPQDHDFEGEDADPAVDSIERRTRTVPRHKPAKGELEDLNGERDIDKKGMKGRTNVGTRDVKDVDTITAMLFNAPMLAGKSMTTARMLELVEWAGGDANDKIAVAWAIFAYWKALYPASTVPFHTFHEVMDIAKNYGVPYAPFYYPDLAINGAIDYQAPGTKKFNQNVPDQQL